AYYIDIEYFFSTPLVLYFDSSNLSFNRYYYYNSNNIAVNLSTDNVPLITNDSALSISYEEYCSLKISGKTYFELHCEASESIKATTLTFEYESPKIQLTAQLDGKTYSSASTGEDVITGLPATAVAPETKKYFLVNTLDNSDKKEVTLLFSKDENNYYMQIITGEDLVSTGSTKYQIYLLDFEARMQFSTDDPLDNSKKKVYVKAVKDAAYYLGYTGAYCNNATQKVTAGDTGNALGAVPMIEYTIGDNFSEGTEIIINTEKYYRVVFSKNYIVENSNVPKITIKVTRPGSDEYSITTATATLTSATDAGSTFNIKPSNELKSGDNSKDIDDIQIIEFSICAYVQDGSIVNIHAEQLTACGHSHIVKIYYKNGVLNNDSGETSSKLFDGITSPYLLSSDTTVGTKDIISSTNLFSNRTIDSISSRSDEYTFVPTTNYAFLADYVTNESVVSDKFIVGVLAPGNSSQFKPSLGDSYFAQSYEPGFNFILAVREADQFMNINQDIAAAPITPTDDIRYSQFEVYEQNKELYIFEGSDEKVSSVEYSSFEDSLLTFYMYGSLAKQYMILVKATTNINDASSTDYKQTTLPIRNNGTLIDYVYKAEIEHQYGSFVSTTEPAATNNNYLASTGGSGVVNLQPIATPFNKNTTDDKYAFFQTINTNITSEVLTHALTLNYNNASYYFINGEVFMEVKSNTGANGSSLTEPYYLYYDNLYVNVKYTVDKDNKICYPTSMEVFNLIYRYTDGGDKYTVEFKREYDSTLKTYVGEHIIKKNGSVINTTDVQFKAIDGKIYLVVSGKRIYNCEVLVKKIDTRYYDEYPILSIDESIGKTGNFASMSINAKLYDSKFSEQEYINGQFVNKADGSTYSSNVDFTINAEMIRKLYYFTRGTDTYYVSDNNVYTDEECVKLIERSTAFGGLGYTVLYSKIKIGRYTNNSEPQKDSTYDHLYNYIINGVTYVYDSIDHTVTKSGSANPLIENEDYVLLLPSVIINGASTEC
ncbi:MAG: hypothetical protein IJA23_00860, partial [Clostridia bacterium]|nr:hypothetical protein [Clostridia bacterium]